MAKVRLGWEQHLENTVNISEFPSISVMMRIIDALAMFSRLFRKGEPCKNREFAGELS